MASLAAIIIGGHLAWKTKNNNNDFYANQLTTVGPVPAGLGFIRAPVLTWSFGKLIGDVFPLTIIAFMESYSVAHRLATRRNELYFLSASQELFANAAANFNI
jgi:MFS superfamily sulfate permease-like transporter